MNDGDSVVRVSGTNRDGTTFSGTGFLIDEEGRVATCWHVVADAAQIRVQIPLYRDAWRYAVLKAEAGDDLAILDPDVKPARPTPFATLHHDWKSDVAIGDAVAAWGYSAWENYQTAPQKFVCTISSFSEQAGLIGLDGTINPGDSGAPVFDGRQRVVGVVLAMDPRRAGQAMCSPVSLLRQLALGVLDGALLDAPAQRVAGDLPTADRGYAVIGREDIAGSIKRELIAGHDQALVVLPGVGKTTLASELVADADIQAHFEAGILWANLGKKPNLEAQLRGWVGALDISLERLKDSRDQIESLKTEVRRAIGTQRMLIVLDDVWEESTAREFMTLGKHCVYLSTTRNKKIASDLVGVGRKWVAVEALPPEAGLRLLREIAPDAVARDESAAAGLVDAVSGLPLALVLIGKFLANAYEDGDKDQLAWAYTEMGKASARLKLSLDEEDSLWTIIDVSYAALADDSLRRAFLALSIFRPNPHAFTAEMAEKICGVDRGAFQALRNMGLIEFRKAGDGEPDGYTMHRVVAEYGRDRLANTSSLEIPRLHGEAVRYYAARMGEDIEHDPNAYLSKYRFEDRSWQGLKEAWLYHLAQTGDTVVAMRAFLRVWFDAFWWWGYYQRFPFCGRLVDEWRKREIDQRARAGLGHVSEFERCYPAGYDKRKGGDWKGVERALEAIRHGMKLDGPLPSLPDEDARLLRAFTDFFLAEACGYGQNNREAALALYHSAHDVFRVCGAAWEANWALFYIAQYFQDDNETERARSYCRRSLEAALAVETPAEVDPELLANDYRLLAELELASDRAAALAAWRYASFYAYAFQAFPQEADSYTMAFYREINGRIVASLIDFHRDDATGAAALCSELRAFWKAYRTVVPDDDAEPDWQALLADAQQAQLFAAIFPPDVDDADLATDKSLRAAHVAATVERLRDALPDARLPPRGDE